MMQRLLCAAALLGGVAAQFLVGCGEAEPEIAAVNWADDPRVVALLSPCPQQGHFDGDTSNLVPILVGKLSVAQLEVLRHLREELSTMGEELLEPIGAYIDRYYTDRHGIPPLLNALGVLRLSELPGAHGSLRRCLEHPNESVRAEAAAGLKVHGLPEDYEPLSHLLAPGVSGDSTRITLLGAMYTADPERLVQDVIGWYSERENTDLWLEGGHCLARAGVPVEGRAALWEWMGEEEFDGHRALPFVLAGLSRGGDEEALDTLRTLLLEGDQDARTRAVEAVYESLSARELVVALEDPDAVIRGRAASLVAGSVEEDWARAALLVALNDPDHGVRRTALQTLLEIGEPQAQDRVLALLGGGPRELESGLMPIREAWDANPELPGRAATLLLTRLSELESVPLEQKKAWLQAVGQIPDPRAAEHLLELARNATGEVARLPAQRWLVRQVGNTAVGRELLRESWRFEDELALRFDLLEAASFGRDDVTRDFLLEVVEGQHATPFERLYASDRLARQGPSARIAPVLKRAALRETHPEVRPAMDCLMWRWYGPQG